MKKLVAPSDPTVSDGEEHVAGGHAVFRTWCRERWTRQNAPTSCWRSRDVDSSCCH